MTTYKVRTKAKRSGLMRCSRKVLNKAKECNSKRASSIIISSVTNLGLQLRDLVLPPLNWSSDGVIEITLCSCGKLSHWGTGKWYPKKQ